MLTKSLGYFIKLRHVQTQTFDFVVVKSPTKCSPIAVVESEKNLNKEATYLKS